MTAPPISTNGTTAPSAEPSRSTLTSDRHARGSAAVPADRRRRYARVCVSAAAGSGLSLAFEPVDLPYLAPVFVAIIVAVTGDRRSTTVAAAGHGYLFGLAFMGTHMWWLTSSIGTGAWLVVTLLEACWLAAFCVCAHLLRRHRWWPVTISAGWAAVEVVRQMWPFGGMPWGQLGFVAVDTAWAASIPYVGVLGMSFLIVLLATASLFAIESTRQRRGWLAAVALVAALSPTAAAAAVPYEPSETGTSVIAVVQGGVPGDGTQVTRYHRQITRSYEQQSMELAGRVQDGTTAAPDFVVWAENSTAVDPIRDPETNRLITDAADAIDVPLLIGGIVDGPDDGTAYNQSILWGRNGPTAQRYTKAHPVPFGEFIPLRRQLDSLSPRFAEIPRDMLPGGDQQPLQVARFKVAVAICFDVAYSEPLGEQVRAGADLIVVQTSNAMFTGTGQLRQQLAISRARAMEAGRSTVIASMNGISAAVTPAGDVQTRLPEKESTSMVVEVATSDSLTPAVYLSPFLPGAALGTVGLGLARALIARPRMPGRRWMGRGRPGLCGD
jgi:apolipoprotein N-acyltransferase